METIKTYMIHWFGPFRSIDEVAVWEKQNSNHVCNLYLLAGKKPYARMTRHYYCGKTIQGVHKRLNNLGHHIEELKEVEEIWMGCFRNINPENEDILIIEKIVTAYLTQVVGDKKMLNAINKCFPKNQICVINRWYKPSKGLWSRFVDYSPARIIPEVILHYYSDNTHLIYGTDKLKRLKIIEDK